MILTDRRMHFRVVGVQNAFDFPYLAFSIEADFFLQSCAPTSTYIVLDTMQVKVRTGQPNYGVDSI